jgi:hypothetical protein
VQPRIYLAVILKDLEAGQGDSFWRLIKDQCKHNPSNQESFTLTKHNNPKQERKSDRKKIQPKFGPESAGSLARKNHSILDSNTVRNSMQKQIIKSSEIRDAVSKVGWILE